MSCKYCLFILIFSCFSFKAIAQYNHDIILNLQDNRAFTLSEKSWPNKIKATTVNDIFFQKHKSKTDSLPFGIGAGINVDVLSAKFHSVEKQRGYLGDSSNILISNSRFTPVIEFLYKSRKFDIHDIAFSFSVISLQTGYGIQRRGFNYSATYHFNLCLMRKEKYRNFSTKPYLGFGLKYFHNNFHLEDRIISAMTPGGYLLLDHKSDNVFFSIRPEIIFNQKHFYFTCGFDLPLIGYANLNEEYVNHWFRYDWPSSGKIRNHNIISIVDLLKEQSMAGEISFTCGYFLQPAKAGKRDFGEKEQTKIQYAISAEIAGRSLSGFDINYSICRPGKRNNLLYNSIGIGATINAGTEYPLIGGQRMFSNYGGTGLMFPLSINYFLGHVGLGAGTTLGYSFDESEYMALFYPSLLLRADRNDDRFLFHISINPVFGIGFLTRNDGFMLIGGLEFGYKFNNSQQTHFNEVQKEYSLFADSMNRQLKKPKYGNNIFLTRRAVFLEAWGSSFPSITLNYQSVFYKKYNRFFLLTTGIGSTWMDRLITIPVNGIYYWGRFGLGTGVTFHFSFFSETLFGFPAIISYRLDAKRSPLLFRINLTPDFIIKSDGEKFFFPIAGISIGGRFNTNKFSDNK